MYEDEEKQIPGKLFFYIGLLMFISTLVAVSSILKTNPHIPAGFEGYVYEKPRMFGNGGYKKSIIGPKNYGISFFRNKVINIDIRPNTYEEKFKILAKDDLNIDLHCSIILYIKKTHIKEIVEHYGGEKWYDRFVKKTFRTYVRESVKKYTSKELKEKRELISEKIKNKLCSYLKGSPILIKNIVVGNIDYPEIVTKAVENKLAAQQLLAEKETQKEIAIKNAEIRIEEAKGIAESQKIINETLTENYLQHEAINAQLKMSESPNHTTVYIPSGNNGIPLIRNVKN